ncbi:hypothetical protein BOX15_Mlig009801g1 [Macrostomum lignano]|uniref:Peptidase S9 prolyl oligopeptidase catalytic domain-containing protein n=1 Tax=Macrostomum lignano TaxID=282301 RepID=A0A267FQE7_9PLAT|nr:hypothetical protein BOX15_Mlig009801g1 [Macrostomum lignano]
MSETAECQNDVGDLDAEEELVGSAPSQKNWKGVVIALLVIVSILLLIACAIFALAERENEMILGEAITFTEAMTMMEQLRVLKYQWVSCSGNDVLLYLNSSNGNLMRAKFYNSNNTAAVETLLNKDRFSEGKILEFSASADCTAVLIPVAKEQTGQHSSKAVYKVVLLKSDSRDFITEKILCPTTNCDASNQQKLQIIRWGTAGRFLAFVYKGNVYYTDNPLEMRPVRITDNLGDPAVSFGAADWLYEEEVLQSDNALWIAPGNLYLAYLQFNDTSVPAYSMPWYGDPGQMYLQSRLIRYPAAGNASRLPDITLWIYDIKGAAGVALKPPTGVPTESYVTKLAWLNESHLVAAWLDRSQTIGYLGVCTALSGGDCRLIYSGNQLDQQDGWMEFGNLLPDTRNGRVLTVLHNSGYRRIASIRLSGQNQVSWISPAKYDVAELLRLELPSQPSQPGSSGRLYFLSCRDDNSDSYDATKMHVHSISATENAPSANCITCPRAGQDSHQLLLNCEFNRAELSKSSHWLLQECLGPEPYKYFVRKNSYLEKYPLALIVEDNLEFSRNLIGRNLPRVEFRQLRLRLKTTLESRADPLSVNAKLLLPKQLNESHISQYPLLMHVHAGPTAQLATRQFTLGWQHYLASSLFVISVSVDARGTRNRGSKFLFDIRGAGFASAELEDQMDSLGQLAQLQYVNKSCIAAIGWDHGAGLALQMLGHHDNVNNTYFDTAVAVAPITDYHYYDAAYTERFLGIKSEQTSENYKRTNVSRVAVNFWNKNILIAHGTGDTKVHYQHSAQLAKVLVSEHIDFEFLTYPDDNHRMTSSWPHLYQKVTDFLLNSFNRTSERHRMLRSRIHNYCPSNSPSAGEPQC